MTALACWATYRAGEVKAPSSIYIASDSRITWGTPKSYWDGGRKIFTCRIEPHMFGYSGDVVFPSLALAQIVSAVDNGLLVFNEASAAEKHSFVYESLKKSFQRRHSTPDQDFSILHAMRTGEDANRTFSVWQITYGAKKKEWQSVPLTIPTQTGIVAMLGSGKAVAKKHIDQWIKSDVGPRSSAFFSGFCDALFSGEDPHSGGAAQIGALNKGSHAQIIGFIDEGTRYLHGLEMLPGKMLHRIIWKDRQFQNTNPSTLKPGKKDRRLVRPKGL